MNEIEKSKKDHNRLSKLNPKTECSQTERLQKNVEDFLNVT